LISPTSPAVISEINAQLGDAGSGGPGGTAPGGPTPTIIVTVNPIDEALQEGDPFKLPEIPETPVESTAN
jgi:hypothetical protein